MRVRGIPGRLLMQEADELIVRQADAGEVMTGSRTMTITRIADVRYLSRNGEIMPLLGSVNKTHEIAPMMRPTKLNVVTMKARGHQRLTVGSIINEFDISARASLPLRVLASPLTLPRLTLLRRLLRRAASPARHALSVDGAHRRQHRTAGRLLRQHGEVCARGMPPSHRSGVRRLADGVGSAT